MKNLRGAANLVAEGKLHLSDFDRVEEAAYVARQILTSRKAWLCCAVFFGQGKRHHVVQPWYAYDFLFGDEDTVLFRPMLSFSDPSDYTGDEDDGENMLSWLPCISPHRMSQIIASPKHPLLFHDNEGEVTPCSRGYFQFHQKITDAYFEEVSSYVDRRSLLLRR